MNRALARARARQSHRAWPCAQPLRTAPCSACAGTASTTGSAGSPRHLAGHLERALRRRAAALLRRRGLAHHLEDRDVGLARELVVPGLVAHHDLEQLVHRLREALRGEVASARARSGRRSRACWRRSPPASVSRGRAVGAASHGGEPVADRRRAAHRAAPCRRPARRRGARRRRGPRSAARAGSRSARRRWPGLVATAACSFSSAALGVALGEQLLGLAHFFFGGQPPRRSARACRGTCAPRASGSAPTKPSTGWPPLNSTQNGMLRTPNIWRQLCGDLGLLVGVQLAELKAAGVCGLELFEHRPERLARAAPRRPDVEQHRLLHRGVDQLGFEVLKGDVDHVSRRGSMKDGAVSQQRGAPRHLQFKELFSTWSEPWSKRRRGRRCGDGLQQRLGNPASTRPRFSPSSASRTKRGSSRRIACPTRCSPTPKAPPGAA